ncbi:MULTISPECIES: hypothetical protein [Nocardia]|nr:MULTISPECIES: hypothetical protein [Nocardia]MBF6183862.1 hypothetical protein [Nocardia farcinica]MBF6248364.1 hypothetical protein [Nocardia elegans]MBF6249170.1 hypothetical protein [Nocardia farcinica]MBF6292805.1 hypothetical protein [Nocardia farcinica]MBF6309705.1 hypothetical protein [Nocardia farcinica]
MVSPLPALVVVGDFVVVAEQHVVGQRFADRQGRIVRAQRLGSRRARR